jgi:phenylpropionate dioxygenase-like ring-hydroxylating dioxygenase large terminal subunit
VTATHPDRKTDPPTSTAAPGADTSEQTPLNLRSLHPSALRERLPETGLREYWYPAVADSSVSASKPSFVKIVGTDLALFRDGHDRVVAIANACPHRGGNLSTGKSHFRGTLTCPYHGWTFNGEGRCVAVLGEGPESRAPGMPDAKVRRYPTQTHKGIVFVWMGDTEPADIREDIPPQFFDPDTLIQHSITTWNCNWRPAMENLLDSHVFYVHRDSVHLLMLPTTGVLTMSKMGPRRPRPRAVNGRGLSYAPGQLKFLVAFGGGKADGTDADFGKKPEPAPEAAPAPAPASGERKWPNNDLQDVYPTLGGQLWPQRTTRLYFSKVVDAVKKFRPPQPAEGMIPDPEWQQAHLPATFQVDYHDHIYSRVTVPIDAKTSRVFYFHTTKPDSSKRRAWDKVYFTLFLNWMVNYNFSGQDARIVEKQYYDRPEVFTATDVFPLTLRRFILENARDFNVDRPKGDETAMSAETATSAGPPDAGAAGQPAEAGGDTR